MWEHCAASRESKPFPLNLNPVLDSFLDTKLPMRNVIVPSKIPTLWPLEGILILWWCRNQAPEKLFFPRAVSLPVLHHCLWEFPGSPWILARGILAVFQLTRWEFFGDK
ncbi:Os06g0103950 [Oryza sativa Japonica Group]|uniref:Os06g0103950 protein n=1 Tax=Oryza sativa subsp. japonica TaxID=39947 RepID=A0A0P0WRU1_ORYSJ|nr:hypothetical protein EE612_031585 [Oryza sativa]BAS95728.1 Os06g0103950 [Oryza sativa Japonica Group]